MNDLAPPNTDEALIREALDYGGDFMPTTNVRDGALAALDRLIAKRESAATELFRTARDLHDSLQAEKEAEARAERLATALQEGIRRLSDEAWMSAGERTRRDYARAALGDRA